MPTSIKRARQSSEDRESSHLPRIAENDSMSVNDSDSELLDFLDGIELGNVPSERNTPAQPQPQPQIQSTVEIPDDREFGGPESADNFSPPSSQNSTQSTASILGIAPSEQGSLFSQRPVARPAAAAAAAAQPVRGQSTRESSVSDIERREYQDPLINSLADATRYSFPLNRFWHDKDLLVIPGEYLTSMASQSKSFSTIRPPPVCEHDGTTWSFVFSCTTGLPEEALKTIYFFEIIKGLAHHNSWNNYVVPTSNLRENLVPKKAPGSKDITGVLKKTFVDFDEADTFHGSDGIDLDKVLSSGDGLMMGDVYTPMDILSISVGFTGAFFTKIRTKADSTPSASETPASTQGEGGSEPDTERFEESGEGRELFCVVNVTGLLNVNLYDFMMNRFISPPLETSGKFDKANERQRSMSELFEHILIFQSSGMMGDTSGKRPSMYFSNPIGRLGIHRLCSPFLVPLKISNFIQKKYSHAKNIKIIGYPDINWQADPRTDSDLLHYLQYSTAYVGHVGDVTLRLDKAISEYNKSRDDQKRSVRRKKNSDGTFAETQRDEAAVKEYEIPVMYGWPIAKTRERYTDFRKCMCPVYMYMRRLGDIDINEKFQLWNINLGALPPVVLSTLLESVLYDYETKEVTDLSSVLLKDLSVPWNLSLVRQKFYGPEANPLDGIATPGYLVSNYNDILQHIQKSMLREEMTAESAVRLIGKAIDHGFSTYISMIKSKAFNSERVEQALEIQEKIASMELAEKMNVHRDVNEYADILIPPALNMHVRSNSYTFAQSLIMGCLVDVNTFEHLNSGNLNIKLELLITTIMYTTGTNSSTVLPFGRLIELAPCGGTLKEQGSKGPLPKMDCPNSAGKDIVHTRIGDIYQQLCTELGIGDSKQGFNVCARATSVAFENSGAIQFINNRVVGVPDSISNMANWVMTECRGENPNVILQMLINFVIPRGDKQVLVVKTTIEVDKNRVMVEKRFVYPFYLCEMCTNQKTEGPADAEKYKTIGAVTHVCEPGSTPFTVEDPNGEFNAVELNPFEARNTALEGHTKKYAPLLLAGTHLMCILNVCLSSWLGVYTPEINPATIALLDACSGWVKHHLSTMFHESCQTNQILRFKRVYEARGAALAAYCKTVEQILKCPDREVAMKRAMLSYQCDAIPINDVGSVIYGLIRRCLSWGPIIYAVTYMKEVSMPIVPLEILVELLNMDQPPPEGERSKRRRWYDAVTTWLFQCVHEQRFCPCNYLADSTDFCEYISSSGTDYGTKKGQGGFRSNQTQNGWKDPYDKKTVQSQLAEELYRICGPELSKTCSISKESIVYIIEDSLNEFTVSVQKLIGVNIQDSDRHFKFFGIRDQIRFKMNDNPRVTPPFMVRAAWINGGESASVGIGFHAIQLLILGSLVGPFATSKIHPKILSDLSCSLVRQILINSPEGAVTSDTVYVPNFNCFTGKHEPIVMGKYEKMSHFYRPKYDPNFARYGTLSECLNFESFAPEDILHMGPLCAWSKLVKCQVWDVPPSAIVTYNIQKNRFYAIYNKIDGLMGHMIWEGDNVNVCMSETFSVISDRSMSWPIEKWNSLIGESGFVMLPMIWRAGACVRIEDDIGCLVPPSDTSGQGERVEHDGNYCYEVKGYFAKVNMGGLVPLHALTVMKTLMRIGSMLFLKCESQSAAPLLHRLEVPISAEDRSKHVLRVFLAGPDSKVTMVGKVYVAYLVLNAKGASGEVACVDPWELLTSSRGREVSRHISV